MEPVSSEALTFAGLKSAYRNKQNIMHLFRDTFGQSTNEQLAILSSYDLQAGSYVAALNNPALAASLVEYSAAVAKILDRLQPASLMEAGVGEATTLLPTVRRMSASATVPILGFDLSWSRAFIGRRHWQAHSDRPVRFFVGEMESVPLADRSVDVVFTSHALEPNHGRERVIVNELGRVAGRYLVLCEPAYEFADAAAKQHMDAHGYCRGLRVIAEEEGWRVREHRVLEVCTNPVNPTAVLVLERAPTEFAPNRPDFACPICKMTLIAADGAYFCENDGLAYPVLRGIPCLSRRNAVIASHYLDTPA